MDFPVGFQPMWFSSSVGPRTIVTPTSPLWWEREWAGVSKGCEANRLRKYGLFAEDSFFVGRPEAITRVIFELYETTELQRDFSTEHDLPPRRVFLPRSYLERTRKVGQREWFQALITFVGVGFRPALIPYGHGTVFDRYANKSFGHTNDPAANRLWQMGFGMPPNKIPINRELSPSEDCKFFSWVNRSGLYCDVGQQAQPDWRLTCAAGGMSGAIRDYLTPACETLHS